MVLLSNDEPIEGPMFHTIPHEEKLSPEDAEIVDVIHTAGRWLGMDGVVIKLKMHRTSRLSSGSLVVKIPHLPPQPQILRHLVMFVEPVIQMRSCIWLRIWYTSFLCIWQCAKCTGIAIHKCCAIFVQFYLARNCGTTTNEPGVRYDDQVF